jgi:large subunit ribosomal protein L21
MGEIMFAIVETGGKQYRVTAGDTLTVDRRPEDVGSTVTLDQVLLVSGDNLAVGAPTVSGATVKATVTGHHKGDKVLTFKYRPTRRHRRRVGFRHSHTTLEIVAIEGVS